MYKCSVWVHGQEGGHNIPLASSPLAITFHKEWGKPVSYIRVLFAPAKLLTNVKDKNEKENIYVSYSFSFVNKLQISGKQSIWKKIVWSLFHLDFRGEHFSYEIFLC